MGEGIQHNSPKQWSEDNKNIISTIIVELLIRWLTSMQQQKTTFIDINNKTLTIKTHDQQTRATTCKGYGSIAN